MEVARTSMIHAATPHFLWPFAVRYAAHQLNLWPCVSEPDTSPILWWTGKVGDASVFRVWGALSLVRDAKASKLSSRTLRCGPAPSGVSQIDPPPLVEPLEISSDSSGPAEGGDPAADDTAATRCSPCCQRELCVGPRPRLGGAEFVVGCTGGTANLQQWATPTWASWSTGLVDLHGATAMPPTWEAGGRLQLVVGDMARRPGSRRRLASSYLRTCLETPPGFPPWPSSPPPQPAAVDSGAEPGDAETEGEDFGGASTGGATIGGAATGGAGSWGAATGGANSGGRARPSGGGAAGDPTGGPCITITNENE
ncbi:unnamed protein product [Closterium sp. NIES-54]